MTVIQQMMLVFQVEWMMKNYKMKIKYFNFNKDVILVEGAKGGVIQDLNNKKLYSIDHTAKKYLKELLAGKNVDEVMRNAESNEREKLVNYLDALVDKSLGVFSNVWIEREILRKDIYNNLDTVWLELTKACNLMCCHCYMDSNPLRDKGLKVLNLNQWEEIILQLKMYIPKRIILIGGEPLLFKEIKQLIEIIKKQLPNTDIVLYSNLTLLKDTMVDVLVKNKVKVITSLYSSERGIHDVITNSKGSFKKTVESIHLLRESGVNIQANTVIMKHNCEEVKTIKEFIYNLTGKKGKIDLIRNVGKSKDNLIPKESRDLDEKIIRKPPFKGISKGEFIRNFSGNSCWQGKINITCDGKISPCIMGGEFIDEKFNINTHTIEEIVNQYLKKGPWLISRDNIKVCCDCEYRYVCKDCRPIAIVNGNVNTRGSNCKYNPYERSWDN